MNTLRNLSCYNPLLRQSIVNFSLSHRFHKQLLIFHDQIHTTCRRLETANTKNNILVYEAPLKARIRIVKMLSITSSMIGFAVFPSVIYDLCKANIFLGLASGVVSTLFLSTPFMLHWITKRYVLQLYYDNENQIFTAKTYNVICQIVEMKFKAKDVTVPDLPGMLSSFLVKDRPLFVDANMIQDPDAYSHMMGYDKPFDITIKVDDQEKTTKES